MHQRGRSEAALCGDALEVRIDLTEPASQHMGAVRKREKRFDTRSRARDARGPVPKKAQNRYSSWRNTFTPDPGGPTHVAQEE